MASEFANLGVDVAEDEEDVFELWDVNRKAFEAFDRLGTQWRFVAISGFDGARIVRTGLDYSAVDVVLRRMHGGKKLFDDIRAMEAAALDAFGEAA